MTYSIQILQHDSVAPTGTAAGMQTEVSKLIFSTRFVTNDLDLEFNDKINALIKEKIKLMTKEEYEERDKSNS